MYIGVGNLDKPLCPRKQRKSSPTKFKWFTVWVCWLLYDCMCVNINRVIVIFVQAATPPGSHSLHVTISANQKNTWGDLLEKVRYHTITHYN